MLSLKKNMYGEQFSALISSCFSLADTFSLTKNRWFSEEKDKDSTHLLQDLAPYYIKTLYMDRWFCYRVPKENPLEIYLFKTDSQARDILVETYDRLFLDGVLWKEPEDLCFFKSGKLIFGSVSHENICFVYGRDLEEQVQNQGEWEQVPNQVAEQIQIIE